MTTCMPSCENFSYMFLNLVGEVGEFASKIAKGIRKNKCQIGNIAGYPNILIPCTHIDSMSPEERLEVRKEAGDILWQLSGVCKVMGWTLEEVAQENLAKLAARNKPEPLMGMVTVSAEGKGQSNSNPRRQRCLRGFFVCKKHPGSMLPCGSPPGFIF